MTRHLLTVHGTWGRRSDWPLPSAPLGLAVQSELPDVNVEPVPWSGANTHEARLSAAKRLAKRLEELSADDVVIVAHSHGGNVARSASARAGDCSGHRRIITVGTPFLTVDASDDALALANVDYMFEYGFGPLFALRLATGRWSPKLPKRVQFVYWPLAACYALSALIATVSHLMSRPLRKLGSIEELMAMVDPPEHHAEIVIVGTPGDETSLALAGGQLIGLLSRFSSKLIVRALPGIERGLVAGLIIYGAGRRLVERRAPERVLGTPTLKAVDGGAENVLRGLSGCLALPLVVHWIDRVSTGWDGVGISEREIEDERYARLTVTPTPRGRHTVEMLPLSGSHRVSSAHSGLLTDATTVNTIAGLVVRTFRHWQAVSGPPSAQVRSDQSD